MVEINKLINLNKNTIRGQLTLWGFFFILVPSFMLISMFAYTEINSTLTYYREYLTNTALVQEISLTSWLKERQDDINQLADTPYIKAKNIANATEFFQAFLVNHSYYSSLLFIDSNGDSIINTDNNEKLNFSERSYFIKALDGQSDISDLITAKTTGEPIIAITSPVFNTERKVIGVVAAAIKLDTINNVTKYHKSHQKENIYIVNKNNILITTDNYLQFPATISNNSILAAARKNKTDCAIYLNFTGKRVLGCYRYVEIVDWIIFSEIDYRQIMQSFYNRLSFSTLGFMLIVLLTLPLTLMIAIKLEKPIKQLTESAIRVQQGDYGHEIDLKSVKYAPHELYLLCSVFNMMLSTIRKNTELLTFANNILTETEAKYRTLVEQSLVGVYIIQNNIIVYANPKFCEIIGYKKENVINVLSPLDLAHAEDKMLVQNILAKQINEEMESVHYEIRGVKKDGTIIYLEIYGSVTIYNGHKAVIGTILDITTRKNIHLELQKARDAALEASFAKSQFLATMSHEIRTPLNAIIGMSELLAETNLTDEQQRYVRVFKTAGENLMQIINDILDLSKVEAGMMNVEYIPFNLYEVIETTCESLIIRAQQKNLKLTYSIADNIPDLLIIDPVRLRQVLINLIGNAIKFTETGYIKVTVEINSADTNKNELILLFCVQDTGIGIPADKLTTIFESFTQVDSSVTRRYGGTGLGLTISKRLVNLMGGDIWVKSQLGKGSSFYFTLTARIASDNDKCITTCCPVYTDKPYAKKHSSSAYDTGPLTILLADDSPDNRLLIESYLKKSPYTLHIAENGQEAVDMVKKYSYDLILMDIQMPVMDGYQATKTIRAWEKENLRCPTIIIALTASALVEDAKKSLEAGCNAHLTKPIKKATLLEAIYEQIRSFRDE